MNVTRARTLRSNPTEPERRLWALTHSLRQSGFHLRRQVAIGPYFADFACHDPAIVIEVDGDTHGSASGIIKDQRRDVYFQDRGYEVLHFTNHDVMANPSGVYDVLAARLASLITPTPDPSPQGGGRHQGRATND